MPDPFDAPVYLRRARRWRKLAEQATNERTRQACTELAVAYERMAGLQQGGDPRPVDDLCESK